METYKVQSGDSLWKIIKRLYDDKISDNEISQKVEELSIFNNISDASKIYTNQVLDLSCFDDLNQEEEINFRDENPQEKNYSSETVKEKTIELYNASQENALDKSEGAKHRNLPEVVEENGELKVVANQEFYKSNTQGPLSGLTIMVNSGHGGYDESGTYFDPGACVGNSEEWIINQDFAEELTEKLLAQGADVLMTQGQFQTVSDIIPDFVQEWGDGANNDNLKMVSIHANISSSSSAKGICYYWSDKNSQMNSDNDLPEKLNDAAKELGLNVNYSSAQKVKILSTANAENIDNVLVELGFMSNPDDLDLMLNSEEYKNNVVDSIVKGLIEDRQS